MSRRILPQLKQQLEYYKKLKKIFEKDLQKQEISIKNSHYLKLLSKLYSIDNNINSLKSVIKQIRKENHFTKQFTKRLIVTFRSKVKLVSLDFEVVLWVDAKNITKLLGKRVGEFVELYNSTFKIEAIY